MTVKFSERYGLQSVLDSVYSGGVDLTGATDSTTALQAAIDGCDAGQTLLLPPGTIKVTSTITLKPGVNIKGYFPGAQTGHSEITTIKFEPTAAGDTLFDGTAAPLEGSYERWGNIEGIKVVGDSTTKSLYAFDWLAPTTLRVCNVRVEGFQHAFRLRDQIFCLFDGILVNSVDSIAGSCAFLFDTANSFTGTTTIVRNSYLRLGELCIKVAADSHSRLRFESILFESTEEAIADIEQGPSTSCFVYFDKCESENVGKNNAGSNQSLFKIGVSGSGSGGVVAKFRDCQFGADSDTAAVEDTRVLFEVDRGRLQAVGIDVNSCGAGVLSTGALDPLCVLRDVVIANDDHPLLSFSRGIQDIDSIVIDHCGWSGFMTHPNKRCVVEHVDLSGASVDVSWTFPRFCLANGYQMKVVEAVNEAGTLDFSGGTTTEVNSATPTSVDSIRSRWFVGDPSANDFELNSATPTKMTFNATTSFSSGRVILVAYYDALPNASAPL